MPSPEEYRHRAERCQSRAAQIRAIAGPLPDLECRENLLRLAASYDLMAQAAEDASASHPAKEFAGQAAAQ
jgi:hypothetical protein